MGSPSVRGESRWVRQRCAAVRQQTMGSVRESEIKTSLELGVEPLTEYRRDASWIQWPLLLRVYPLGWLGPVPLGPYPQW